MRYPFKIVDYELLASFGTVTESGEFAWDGQKVVAKATGLLYGWEIPNLVIQ